MMTKKTPKRILITGASRGIGFATALRLAELGHHVMAISRDAVGLEELEKASNGHIKTLVYDIVKLDENPIEPYINEAMQGLDILINNAGQLIHKDFEAYQTSEIERLFWVNTIAPGQLVTQLKGLLKAAPEAHVVNVSSMGGFQGSVKFAGLSWYSASKAALACLTEVLAQEFAQTAVRFNCLAFGAVQTQMLQEAFPGYRAPLSSDEMAEWVADFAINGHRYFNGKTLPVSVSTP